MHTAAGGEAPYDVAIVGAGIAGVSVAARLAASRRVLLLERESLPGQHSTGRSAAMYIASYGPPQVQALTRASLASYAAPQLLPVLSPRGVLYAAWAGQEVAWHAFQAAHPVLPRLSAAEALARVPALRADGLLGAAVDESAMDIDVDALLQGWLRLARRQGAQLWTDASLEAAERLGDEDGEDGAWRLRLADGREAAARVLVNAAGAWADTLAQAAGVDPLGLQPRRRSAFTFDAPADAGWRNWPAVVAVDESFYFKPDAGQLLGSPANADPVPAHDVLPEALDIALGIAHIEQHTTLRIRRPRHTWAGLRTFAPDGEPVIGFDARARGFFWLAGQGGYGIQSAAGAALLAESLILGTALPEALRREGLDPARLAPGRFRDG